MSNSLLARMDSLAAWRRGLDRGVEHLLTALSDGGLLDAPGRALGAAVRQRLASDRLVLAFVAEFSRGKSELINALFFADTGHRVLPATPGRTTMCPVELAWDAQQPPSLQLLPIATRAGGQSVLALREQPDLWQQMALPVGDGEAMAQVLQQVMRVQRVPLDEARALGFWSDEHPEDNPPRDAHDQVEVPAWRHALINYPHPLLQRGLVVVDTPGLNAIGAEPELTLSLLPTAHAAVFLLAADAGVTRSDLAVWRDHLGDRGCERFVVLNKIDTLADPLLDAAQVAAQVQRQCDDAAATLGVEPGRVFALSARQALAARVQGDEAALAASRLPALEQALVQQLLPQRSRVIGRMVEDGVLALHQLALRRLSDRQRELADQGFELRSLRGKSAARLRLLSSRLEAEAAEFERCAPRLAALRAVLARQQEALLAGLSGHRLSGLVRQMREGSQAGLLKLGAARAFAQLGTQLKAQLATADLAAAEIEQLLRASIVPLNAECGLALSVPPRPALDGFERELDRVQDGYSRYVGLTQRWRLAQPEFMDRFCRLLQSRLRVVFEGVAHDIETWGHSMSHQIDEQLRERRHALAQRREAHGRVRQAEDGLERSIQGIEALEARAQRLGASLAAEVDGLRILAATAPEPGAAAARAPGPVTSSTPGAGIRAPHLQLVTAPMAELARGAA
ncbi:MAG: dynamin family protein [Burkholderiales bacterium RIFCSPHIGHO2_12_FULL_69_20]|nr:MAG: dynamin family protein [Burkholderiales bacterium RIFCSPHIGHO2_12_FULL_69_20]